MALFGLEPGMWLVAATTQESTYVKLGKTWNAKLPVLFNVNQLVKKQTICEVNVRHEQFVRG